MSLERRRWSAARSALWLAGAFAAGSIPTGRILTRMLTGSSLDELGDGKPGSANVGRSVSWGAGATVLALDAGKAVRACHARALVGGERRLGGGHGHHVDGRPHHDRRRTRGGLRLGRYVRDRPAGDDRRPRAACRREPAAPSSSGGGRDGGVASAAESGGAPPPAPRLVDAAAHRRAVRGADTGNEG